MALQAIQFLRCAGIEVLGYVRVGFRDARRQLAQRQSCGRNWAYPRRVLRVAAPVRDLREIKHGGSRNDWRIRSGGRQKFTDGPAEGASDIREEAAGSACRARDCIRVRGADY